MEELHTQMICVNYLFSLNDTVVLEMYSTPLCKSGSVAKFTKRQLNEIIKSYKNNINSSTKVKFVVFVFVFVFYNIIFFN